MNFKEALIALDISDYEERIFNSNSKGELFHLAQYFDFVETFKDNKALFRIWFEENVKYAEENWQRPESIFQHMDKIFQEQYEMYKRNN